MMQLSFLPGDVLALKDGFTIAQARIYDNKGFDCRLVAVMRSCDIALVVFPLISHFGAEVLVVCSNGVVWWMTLGGLERT